MHFGKHHVGLLRSPSSLVTPRQPISSCREMALSLLMSQYSTNFFTHFFGLDFLRRKRLKGLISFFPMSPLEFLSSWLKYQWTTLSSRVWLGSGSAILKDTSICQFIAVWPAFPFAKNFTTFDGRFGGGEMINSLNYHTFRRMLDLWQRAPCLSTARRERSSGTQFSLPQDSLENEPQAPELVHVRIQTPVCAENTKITHPLVDVQHSGMLPS